MNKSDLEKNPKGKSFLFSNSKKKKRRVVITGIGVVSPIGMGIGDFWENLLSGKTGVDKIKQFDPEGFPCEIAAEVKEFQPEKFLSKYQLRAYSRATQFASIAGKLAVENAKLSYIDPYRTEVIMGSAISSLGVIEKEVHTSPSGIKEYESGILDPLSMYRVLISGPSYALAMMYDVRGYVTTVSSACTSGINAIGLSAERIRDGRSEIAITGGVDTPINKFTLAEFCNANFLNTSNDPQDALCPFDSRRTKHLLGEGSAVFILEESEHAISRGATIYGEILSFNQGTENVNELFMLQKSGRRWSEIIQSVLNFKKRSKIPDTINAFGPSDFQMDFVEVEAIKRALGKKAKKIPVSSIKGAVGSGFSSAGAFQMAAGAMTLKTGLIPPIFNYKEEDPKLDLLFTKEKSKKLPIQSVLINGHGLGGVISEILLQKFSL